MDRAGVRTDQIEHVYLAGGFGYYLDVESACRIGLLPAQLEDKTTAVGNTSLAGSLDYGLQPHSSRSSTKMARWLVCLNFRRWQRNMA